MVDYLLKEARLHAREGLVDLALRAGKVVAAEPNLSTDAKETWALGGRVVLPALVDAHVHLDKTHVPLVNQSGTLQEAISLWREKKPQLEVESYKARALKAVGQALLNGTTFMRTHVDVAAEHDFRALEALLSVRDQVKNRCELQVVALGNPGASAAETKAVQTALELGADLVGGAPALTKDPQRCIDTAFDLAERFDRDVDLHVDETEDPAVRTLDYLAEQTLKRGFQKRVTAGHCCSLAFMPDEAAARLIDRVAEAQLNVVTLPSCNLVLMGRGRQPTPRGLTRVKELLAAGVNVAAASDNVRDPFNPFGKYDALFNANLAAHAAHLTSPNELVTCLEMVTKNAAQVMGKESGLEPGTTAHMVILDSTSPDTVVTALPERFATFYQGKCVVRQTRTETWSSGWT